MRRLITFLVFALVVVPVIGARVANSAVAANNVSVSNATLSSEIATIATTPSLRCYVASLWGINFARGAGSDALDSAAIATWSNLRLEGTAVVAYATSQLGFRGTPAQMASGRARLLRAMTQAAGVSTCTATPETALNALSTSSRTSLIAAQAASELLLTSTNAQVGTDDASLLAWYQAHLSDYDNICVTVAYVPHDKLSAFVADNQRGVSLATLASRYSVDASATNGGNLGCYGPATNARTLLRGVPTGVYAQLRVDRTSHGTFYLFVAPRTRTTNPFSAVSSTVLADVEAVNAGSGNALRQDLFANETITVNPAVGRFVVSGGSLAVLPPATPPLRVVPFGGAGLDSSSALRF